MRRTTGLAIAWGLVAAGLVAVPVAAEEPPATKVSARAQGPTHAARRGTVLVTRAHGGGFANGGSSLGRVSGSGSTVAFVSYATNLLRRELPSRDRRSFVWDRATRRTELVSVATDGSELRGHHHVSDMSADGRKVLIHVYEGGRDAAEEWWLRDRDARTTTRVPDGSVLDDAGRVVTYPPPPEGWSYEDSASRDGRFIVRAQDGTRPFGEEGWEQPWELWDNHRQAVVGSGTMQQGAFWQEGIHWISDDGRFLRITGGGEQGRTWAQLIDVRTGLELADSRGRRMSDDTRWLVPLTRRHPRLISRTRPGRAVPLWARRPKRTNAAFIAMSGDARAIAYEGYGRILPKRAGWQLYYWRRGS